MQDLLQFIVKAKAACYVGGGDRVTTSRAGSHDLVFSEGSWRYLDSYFGGTDFHGQETIWNADVPIWAMGYYGYILQPNLINSSETGAIIKAALTKMYQQDRFLDGFEFQIGADRYSDRSIGTFEHFSGTETIQRDGVLVYQLDYQGGLIKA
jgi:hypothetical protein